MLRLVPLLTKGRCHSGDGAPSLRVGGDGDPESSDDDVPLVQAASRSAVSSNKGVPQQWDGAAMSIPNIVPDGARRVRRQKGDDVRSCYVSAGQSDLPLLDFYDLEGDDVAPAVSCADLLLYGDPLDKARHSPGTLMVITVPVPVREANKAPRFVESRLADIQKHLKLGAVKLVRKQDVPKGTRIIGVRFADFDKFEGEECIEQKSRVAAKGFMQRKGIDCGDVVITTPDELAIRTIFALATLQHVFLEAGDDESAFLKAKRDTPFEAWVGVHGLRDSGHLYHTRCVLHFYASVGLKPNPYDQCLFMGVDTATKRTVLAITHVDDYALAPPSDDYSNWFWGRLRERQGTIKVSKPMKVLLGREVWQYVDDKGVFHTHVTVREYIMDLIRKYPRADGKQWTPVAVPWLPLTGAPTRPSELNDTHR
eukprot:g60531.t1